MDYWLDQTLNDAASSREGHLIPDHYRRTLRLCRAVAESENSTFLRVRKGQVAIKLLAIDKYRSQSSEFLSERAQAHLVRVGLPSLVNLVSNPCRVTAIAILEGIK